MNLVTPTYLQHLSHGVVTAVRDDIHTEQQAQCGEQQAREGGGARKRHLQGSIWQLIDFEEIRLSPITGAEIGELG